MKEQVLPDLSYDYGALEPVISGKIMEIHHSKHHAAYVANLNKALAQYAEAEEKGDLAAMIGLQQAIKFNGGGHLNHSIFWTNLAPQSEGGGEPPLGELAEAINAGWGSLENFIAAFNGQAGPLQGSGWCWLGYHKASKSLKIVTRSNQDPAVTADVVPLLGVDVWEHAYYLQYENRRPEYLKEIWNVVNWKNVAERYENAK